jgi:hypothetical protein
MKSMSSLAFLAIVAAAVAGCGEKSASTPTSATPSNATATAPSPATESADAGPTAHRGAPMRKSGWWQFNPEGQESRGQYLCISEATEAKFSAFDQITQEALLGYKCSTAQFTRSGDGWAFDTACDTGISESLGGGVMTSKGTIKGNIRTNYKIAMTVTQAGQTNNGTIVAAWKSECPSGRSPGDLVDGDMLLMNILKSTTQQ